MGNGITIYLVEEGKPAVTNDLVNVFDPAPRECVTTLAEQEAASAKWFKSVRSEALQELS